MSEHGFPDGYLEDFVRRALARAEAVQTAIDILTPFERRLLREAAVMGHVLGQMYGRDERLPADHLMIRSTVEHCIDVEENFPLLAVLSRGARPEVSETGGHIPGGSDDE